MFEQMFNAALKKTVTGWQHMLLRNLYASLSINDAFADMQVSHAMGTKRLKFISAHVAYVDVNMRNRINAPKCFRWTHMRFEHDLNSPECGLNQSTVYSSALSVSWYAAFTCSADREWSLLCVCQSISDETREVSSMCRYRCCVVFFFCMVQSKLAFKSKWFFVTHTRSKQRNLSSALNPSPQTSELAPGAGSVRQHTVSVPWGNFWG